MAIAVDEELAERLSRIEHQLQEVSSRLDRLEGRVEKATEPAAAPVVLGAGIGEAVPAAKAIGPAPGTLALVGRTLLALGGGFLIRALTEGGALPRPSGVALGLAYAVGWLVLADRVAAKGGRTSATFHGLAGALLGYPLLWEAATRFGIVTPGAAVVLGVLVLVIAVTVAGRRGLAPVIWLATFLALGTTFGLLFATHDVLAAVFGLLAIAIVVLSLALRDQQPGLRWPTAALADLSVLVLVWVETQTRGLPADYPPVSPGLALLATLGLPAVFFGGTVAQTLGRARRVDSFEVIQGALALALGFGGGSRLLAAWGQPPLALGVLGGVLGVLSYWAGFALVERRHAHASSFHFYSAAGGVLTLFGTVVLLRRGGAVLAWCGLTLLMAGLGRRGDRVTLGLHAGAYLLAAAAAAGLVQDASRALLGDVSSGGPGIPRPGLVMLVVATAAAVYGLMVDRRPGRPWWQRLPETLAAAVATWGLGGLLVGALAPSLGSRPFTRPLVATLPIAVLSLLAVGLAEGARRPALRSLGWLVYPLLAIAGVKLVAHDLPSGNATTQFLSFALYGAALIAAPRRLRR